MDYARDKRADALAAQFVTGTLRGGARRRFQALLPSHPALQRAVAEWEARLMPLTAAVQPVEPPQAVWAAVEHRLWGAPARPQRWWQRVAAWQATTAAALALALAIGVQRLVPPPANAPIVVVLQATGAAPGTPASFIASLSADGRAMVTRPVQPVSLSRPDAVLELWAVPAAGRPRSLGLVSATGVTVIERQRLEASGLRSDNAGLAVSVEPPGGSPTGAPTGPVIYSGALRL